MNYPTWDVPVIGSGLVIAIIAIYHVFISHFAVGGGFYLPLLERAALAKGRPDWLEVLKGHTKFFVVLTGAFGTVSGIGIWFAIGLASPAATSSLIHFWVLGWAMEWVSFIVELTALVAYYYLWGRIPPRVHLLIGWIYALAAWSSLVIINGILTFMLTPTDTWLQAVGSGRETFTFWTAFFNPTYLPSLVIRTLICVSWAGVFALITAARIDGVKLPDLKLEMIAYARRWLLPAFILLPICFAWFVTQMPEASQALLTRGLATSAQGAFTIITRLGLVLVLSSAVVVVVTWLFTSADNARDFSLGNALSIAAVAFMVMASTEMVREMLRKPYVVSGYMYSNGTRPVDTERLNTAGYLTRSPWDTPGETGLRMFQGQCLSCHTRDGYRSLRRLLAGRDRQGIESLIKILRENKPDSPYRAYMPPVVGTDDEVKALVDYLASEFPPKGK